MTCKYRKNCKILLFYCKNFFRAISELNQKTSKISCYVNFLPHKVDGILKIADILSWVTLSIICVRKLFSRPDFPETGDLFNTYKMLIQRMLFSYVPTIKTEWITSSQRIDFSKIIVHSIVSGCTRSSRTPAWIKNNPKLTNIC